MDKTAKGFCNGKDNLRKPLAILSMDLKPLAQDFRQTTR